ncbi:MAG TPA: hypothetical protein VLC46_09690 [Thermoanaerobaculia bacterium]|jgi:uncharacterized repeat protein (TIGR01451 family)|nr:hypothetical protein [Thermoanaerobaculia bacterium]
MSDIDRVKLRTVLVSCCVTIAAIAMLGVATAFAICIPTVYNVTSSAPPPIGNWTDTSGAVWTPSGGFPGCAPGDNAADLNAAPTTLIINSAIPNPIIGLNLSCPGCAIDIQSGGSLTLAGPSTISSSSTIIVEPGGTLTIANGASLNVNSGTSLSVNGGLVDIQSGGSVTLTGASTVTSGGVLNVDGGTLTIPGGSLFTVQSSGQLEFTAGSVNGGGTINNHGTIQMVGSGLVTVSAIVNNSAPGTVHVSSGTLALASGGTGDAPFLIDSGGTLGFPAGSYTMTPNGSVSGNGTLSVTGGSLSIGGVTSPGAFAMTGGTLTGAGFLSVVNSMTWSGGTLTGSGGTELAGTGVGTIDGSNGGVDPMVLDGRSFNNYGTIHDTAPSTSPVLLSNGANFTTYGYFYFEGDGSITGASPASFNVSPNGVLAKTGGSLTSTINPSFTNTGANAFAISGTLEFAGNTSLTGGIFFANNGATLKFSAATTTFDGSSFVTTDSISMILFSAGTATVSGTYIVDGSTDICGATVDMTSGVTSNFKFTSGLLDVLSDFTMTGTGTWSGGAMGTSNPNAFFDVAPSATLDIDAANSPTDDFLLFANDGTVDYTDTGAAGNYLKFIDDAIVDNTGLFDIQIDGQIISGSGVIAGFSRKAVPAPAALTRAARMARLAAAAAKRKRLHVTACVCLLANEIDNSGTLQKSAGTGTTDFGPFFDNTGAVNALSGTLNFLNTYTQTAGSTTLGPGNIQLSSPLALNGGTLNGAGLITGSVASDGGEVAPGTASTTGVINLTADYSETSASKVTIKIAGPSTGQFDQLNVPGTATLAGTFNSSFIGGYTPATGTTIWSVLTYANHSGAFATVTLPTYSGGTVTSAYDPTSFDLTAVTPPAADLKLVMGGPATDTAAAPLSYTIDVSNLGPNATSGVITVVDTLPTGATAASGLGTNWTCGAPSGGVITCTTPGPLASGNALPTLTISMTAPVASGNVTNSATVSNSVFDPVTSNNTGSVTTNVGPQANLAITKTNAGATPVNPGQNFSYTIVVTNNGPSTSTGTVVTDNTPVGIAFVSNSGGCTSTFPCNLGTLTAGQSVTITSTYSIPPSYSGGAISNTASVSANENDPNLTDNSATATTPVGAAADVGITKTTSQSSVSLGQNITYTITVSNFGPAGATGVVVADPTPAGLTVVSISGGGCTSFPCTIGALAVGPPVTITAIYNVPANYTGTSVTNTATVSSASDPNSSNNTASATSTISAQADLSISKTGPPSVTVGQNISYTISVTNSGQLAAANTFVNDSTPAGLTFVSNGGACTGPFPCALGTMATGQTAVITSTFSVPANYAGTTISNTATVSTSSPESNTSNNSSTATTPISSSAIADLVVTKTGPGEANPTDLVDFTIIVNNNGPGAANNVVVADPTPPGLTFLSNTGGCTTPYPCVFSSIAAGGVVAVTGHYRVSAQSGSITNTASASSSATDPVPANNSSSVTMNITPGIACPQPPVLNSPSPGATVSSPVTLSWHTVASASNYIVTINGPSPSSTQTLSTTSGSVTLSLLNGSYSWSVQAVGTVGCTPASSGFSSFSVCNTPGVPIPSVVSLTTTGQTYSVQWTPVDGATSYELQESSDAAFSAPGSTTLPGTSQTFTKNVSGATAFYYRVRVVGSCSQAVGAFSATAPVVIVPLPPIGSINPNIPVPAGSTQPVTFPIHVNGLPGLTTSFVATVDKTWLAVTPASGIMPPEGLTFTISADPSSLQDGTWTGTVIIVFGSSGVSGAGSKRALDTTPKASIPVSISLTTPVSPSTLSGPSATAVVIPSVGHLAGFSSDWQSDIRIANITALSKNVQLTFSTGSASSSGVKQTTLNIAPGATTALDDIVSNWFGVGGMGDSSNGVLTVQPLDATGKPDLSVTTATVASSRTYNVSAAGTLGQFIPAVPLANFISKAPGASSILSLQQISQSSTFRTNLGLVEVTGNPASLLVNVFDGGGSKVLALPISLGAGEQRQLNSFLANQGITLTNGHIEVQATGGTGKVTAYASVIDDQSTAPLLVPGVPLGGAGASRFVIPGVASLDTAATWRSDVRIFNGSATPQTATLTLYPTANPTASVTQNVTIQPGEVEALDDIVHATFNLTNAGGALHVTTATATPLIVTARTYNVTPGGTLGQFIQAVTPADAVGNGDRSLQLLQMEDSPRYRTNLGLAEVTGKPATAEVTVILPDSKVAPKVQIPLAPFEYRQFAIISSLGLGNTYDARISVRVIDGQGKITAYGSVVDQQTQDPTYVPAQ